MLGDIGRQKWDNSIEKAQYTVLLRQNMGIWVSWAIKSVFLASFSFSGTPKHNPF